MRVLPESTPSFSNAASSDSVPSFPEKIYPSLSLTFTLLFYPSPKQDYARLYAWLFLEMTAQLSRQISTRFYA